MVKPPLIVEESSASKLLAWVELLPREVEPLEILTNFGCAWIDPSLAPKALKVSLVVGSILFIVNHGAAAIGGEMTPERWGSALLTYLVPYTVSIHGQWLASRPNPPLTD